MIFVKGSEQTVNYPWKNQHCCKFKVLKSNLQIQYLAVPLAGMVAEKLNLAKKLTASQK